MKTVLKKLLSRFKAPKGLVQVAYSIKAPKGYQILVPSEAEEESTFVLKPNPTGSQYRAMYTYIEQLDNPGAVYRIEISQVDARRESHD